MNPQSFLRLEGLAAFTAAVGIYLWLGGPIWLLVVLALAPDLSMLGYLAGPRLGSRCYNLVHTYTLPTALGAGALWLDSRLALLITLIWVGHIGIDRAVGYGLKYESGFQDTHLSAQPAPVAALTDTDE